MSGQESEILSFNIKTNLDLDTVKNNSLQWLQKISAKVEDVSPNRISAKHILLYPSYPSKIKIKHIDPSYWEKRIELKYIEEINGVTINITLYSLTNNIAKKSYLKKWWLFWIFDLTKYLGLNISLPLYTSNDIGVMQKEIIYNSKYLIIIILINIIIGWGFFISPLDTIVKGVLGILFITNSLSIAYQGIRTYRNINKKLFKYQINNINIK